MANRNVGAVPPELTDAMARIDTETTALAAYVEGLKSTVKTSMTAAEVATHVAGLTSVADRLKAVATDPANPIPPGPVPVFQRP